MIERRKSCLNPVFKRDVYKRQTYNALSWDEVKGADGYRVYDGDALIGETTDTAFLLREDAGQHNIRLVSYKGDKDKEICNFSYSVPALSEKAYTCLLYTSAQTHTPLQMKKCRKQSLFHLQRRMRLCYNNARKV